ncbi:MAG TPA: hypothetical protein VL614_30595 [Acetobacteraceae bacterium]|jgi:hypothetical protein|nr:hypothetical protein [Acetobacteraceae bacterium]
MLTDGAAFSRNEADITYHHSVQQQCNALNGMAGDNATADQQIVAIVDETGRH